ncbi:hypothetical protein [Enterobacter cancerogenus]
MTVIATVLRSGGEYRPEHVQRLHAQFNGLPSVCLSDVPVPGVRTIPLVYDWPGWFAKMELFNPALIGRDILYLDIDTLVVNNLANYLHDIEFRMLSDFYYPEKPASGVMFIPHEAKESIWNRWFECPAKWMKEYRGDQDVLRCICGDSVARFGEKVKSYKVHVAGPGMPGYHNVRSQGNGIIPPGTDILCFHGKPRPWNVDLPEACTH